MLNYFSLPSAAERYSRGRPDFQEATIQRVRNFLQVKKKFERALDIACGTGLSTKALLNIAAEVYGSDSSADMLEHALEQSKITYLLAKADQQPFPENYFDLITVCSAIHWMDIDAFLAEANRLLKASKYLVLYDNYFLAELEHTSGFKEWYEESYLKEFPSPARNNSYVWDKEKLRTMHFEFLQEETFKNPVQFNKAQLILYFSTQSNIIAKIAAGALSYAQVEEKLNLALADFFVDDIELRTFYFGNWIKYLRKIN